MMSELLSRFAFKSNLRRYNVGFLCAVKNHLKVGPAGICFFFRPNSLCFISQNQPIMLGLCP